MIAVRHPRTFLATSMLAFTLAALAGCSSKTRVQGTITFDGTLDASFARTARQGSQSEGQHRGSEESARMSHGNHDQCSWDNSVRKTGGQTVIRNHQALQRKVE